MPRVRFDVDMNELRRRLGLTEQQLPDHATEAQIEAAFLAMPQVPSHQQSGLPADDMVLIERDEWDRVQRERQIAANRSRDELLDRAVRRGKFAPHRRSHYATLYDSDPQGVSRQIAAMADGVIPTDQRGDVSASSEDFGSGEAYPTHWLPDVHHQHDRIAIAAD